jgi:hypothetical protein
MKTLLLKILDVILNGFVARTLAIGMPRPRSDGTPRSTASDN